MKTIYFKNEVIYFIDDEEDRIDYKERLDKKTYKYL